MLNLQAFNNWRPAWWGKKKAKSPLIEIDLRDRLVLGLLTNRVIAAGSLRVMGSRGAHGRHQNAVLQAKTANFNVVGEACHHLADWPLRPECYRVVRYLCSGVPYSHSSLGV